MPMQIGLGPQVIGDPPLGIVFYLVETSSLGRARNKMLLQDQALKQSIELWLLLRVSWYGQNNSLLN